MTPRRILTAREQLEMLSPWREASAAQDEAEARGERLPPLPIRRQQLWDRHWMKKPWAEAETLLRPHGKNVTLYHRTTPERADRLVEKGFKRKKNPDTKDVYFSDVLDDAKADGFGDAIVKMVLPRHLIGPGDAAPQTIRHRRLDDPDDTEWHQDGPAENWYAIDSKHLKGLPVERIAYEQRNARLAATVDGDYGHIPRDEHGRLLLWRGVDGGGAHITYVNQPDPAQPNGNPFHFRPPESWDEVERNHEIEDWKNYGSWWGDEGEAKFYGGDNKYSDNDSHAHGAMAVQAWFPRERIHDTPWDHDGILVDPGTQGEIAQAHVYHQGKGWLPLHDAPGRTVTAALSEDEGQKMREVYAPHDPANPPEHLRPHLMLPIGAAHHYREYDRPYDDVLGQVIADQGIRQPLRISTDGTHATMHEGNHRLEIAKRLGLTHVPVQVTLEKPGEVINNGGRPPVPLEQHLGEWVDQNRHRLKSFWKG